MYAGHHFGDNRYETVLDKRTSDALVKLAKHAPDLAYAVGKILTEGVASKEVIASLENAVQHINWDVAYILMRAGESINEDTADLLSYAGRDIKEGAEKIQASTGSLDSSIDALNRTIERARGLKREIDSYYSQNIPGFHADPPLEEKHDWRFFVKFFLIAAAIGFVLGIAAILYFTNS